MRVAPAMVFRLILCLFIFLGFIEIGFAKSKKTRICLDYLTFAPAVYRMEIVKPKSLEQLRELYLVQPPLVSKRQMNYYQHAFTQTQKEDWLVLTSDFTVVSQLNRILGNKSYTASLWNLYKRIFINKISENTTLSQHIKMIRGALRPTLYVDYQTMSFVFDLEGMSAKERQNILKELEGVAEKSNEEFFEATSLIPELKNIEGGGTSLIHNRRRWVLFGIGKNGQQAAVAARILRFEKSSKSLTKVHNFDEIENELQDAYLNLERLRKQVRNGLLRWQKEASVGGDILKEVPLTYEADLTRNAKKLDPMVIPSDRIFEAFSKALATNRKEYIEEVQSKISSLFQTQEKMPPSLIELIQAYFHQLDVFMPPILQEREVSFLGVENPSKGKRDVFYFDITKQGVRNRMKLAETHAQLVYEDPKTANLSRVRDLLNRVFEEQKELSLDFKRRIRAISQTQKKLGIEGDRYVSGDEYSLEVDGPISKKVYQEYLDELAIRGIPLRSLWISTQKSSEITGEDIVILERASEIVRSHLREKGMPYEVAKELIIGVHSQTQNKGEHKVILFFAHKNSHLIKSFVGENKIGLSTLNRKMPEGVKVEKVYGL